MDASSNRFQFIADYPESERNQRLHVIVELSSSFMDTEQLNTSIEDCLIVVVEPEDEALKHFPKKIIQQ